MQIQWKLKPFEELTIQEFHQILQLRINVFVVEQNCVYKELDGKDTFALHLFGYKVENPLEIVAYTRIFKPGDYYQEAAFGRVVVAENYRSKNIGNQLIKNTIQAIENNFKTKIIKISAQTYLEKFYKNHGFIKHNEEYLEDGIPHIEMLKN